VRGIALPVELGELTLRKRRAGASGAAGSAHAHLEQPRRSEQAIATLERRRIGQRSAARGACRRDALAVAVLSVSPGHRAAQSDRPSRPGPPAATKARGPILRATMSRR
jgi:hypothetical protein